MVICITESFPTANSFDPHNNLYQDKEIETQWLIEVTDMQW